VGATLVLGTKKGLLILEQGAKGDWRSRPIELGGIHVSLAVPDPRNGTLWAALDHGHWGSKLSRSKDGGRTWTEVAPPKYPEGATGPCTKKPASLRYIYGLQPGRKQEPDRLYLGSVPGGLFVSEDAGASWSFVDALFNHATREKWGQGGKDFDDPGLHSVVIDPRDPRKILVGISSAGVMGTSDGGKSWEPRNKGLKNTYMPDPNAEVGHDPHFMTACAGEPDVVWQQNHCGVFRSTDGARSWTEISQPKGPVNFGFPIAADAKDPECAWVVPATSDEKRYAVDGAMCVGRTTDGGKRWEILREGLPQEGCYDVAYRHALDARADALAFGTTTGNLYTSQDRGETWRCLGSNFPPILSVRYI
jgi:photosystem II stability/assembly factor-like uncharacterized protein